MCIGIPWNDRSAGRWEPNLQVRSFLHICSPLFMERLHHCPPIKWNSIPMGREPSNCSKMLRYNCLEDFSRNFNNRRDGKWRKVVVRWHKHPSNWLFHKDYNSFKGERHETWNYRFLYRSIRGEMGAKHRNPEGRIGKKQLSKKWDAMEYYKCRAAGRGNWANKGAKNDSREPSELTASPERSSFL